jgi:ribonucleoside-diphosphate reductase alpha chain
MGNSPIAVVKRDGSKELLNPEKIHKVVFWACEGLAGVSPSEVEMRAQLQIENNTTTKTIHEMLIKSAAELISEDSPNYQYVAARLVNYHLRKEVYGRYEPWTVKQLVEANVKKGHYTSELLEAYNDLEWNKIEKIVKHQRDDLIAFAGMEQWRGKYLVKDRVKGEFFETPQMALVLIAALGFAAYPKDTRLEYVKDFYDAISQFDVSLPTPIMAGLRTPQKQFSSCVTITSDDSLDSLVATNGAIVKYISQKAGLGIDMSRVRAIGSPIRAGDAEHTGLLPFVRWFQSAVKSCSQGGVRGGSATVHFPLWHYEFQELVVLKNNKGTEFNRIRQMDYSFLFNRLMYQRLVDGGDITFFSPKDVPGLLEAFWTSNDKFEELYEQYEADPTIRKRTMKAIDVFIAFMTERKETGRIYLMNIDHANSHGSYIPELAPITQSNLCQEITLPTLPLQSLDDPNGRISLCTLAALNWGRVKTPHDFEKPARLVVRFLDEILSYQNYPVVAANEANREFRPLGVGIVNLAYFLAKNGVGFNDDALPLVDEYAEAYSYYLIKASVDLAREKGACESVEKTKYGSGVLPIDTYKKDVDELVPHQERMPWAELREELKEVGIRNSTLMALMPAETSAQISNATNGIEPVRALVSEKVSKHGVLKQVVPEIQKLKNKYDLLWDQKSPTGYLKISCVLLKYLDQSASVNTSYNPQHYEGREISMKDMLTDLLMFYKYGGKNLYYFNTYDGQEDPTALPTAQEQADQDQNNLDILAALEDEDCDSCKL